MKTKKVSASLRLLLDSYFGILECLCAIANDRTKRDKITHENKIQFRQAIEFIIEHETDSIRLSKVYNIRGEVYSGGWKCFTV